MMTLSEDIENQLWIIWTVGDLDGFGYKKNPPALIMREPQRDAVRQIMIKASESKTPEWTAIEGSTRKPTPIIADFRKKRAVK